MVQGVDEVQRSTVEQVVLLDEHGQPSGTAPKATVHRTVRDGGTPLLLAFSCHVVDSQDDC